jgi:GH25 family lysozyme M1 (1,4-beta-N-acetylmuramidase)/nucleoside phosphorylase/O-acetyl-ADP-ribose deacetylase (regulator of RNase III)
MITSSDSVDFLIITALEKEAQAVVSRLEKHTLERFETQTYHCGTIPIRDSDDAYRVVVVLLPSMGELAVLNATTIALTHWNPQFVLMVGIAWGFTQNDLDLGDVVVADQVVGYEYGKLTDGGIKPRDHVYPTSALLLDRMRNFWEDDWAGQVNVPRPAGAKRTAPKRFVGPIASGNKVIASTKFQEELTQRWPKLIAVEMEAEGVFAAVFDHPQIQGTLVIRGISDMADERKVDEWQAYAANAAAAFAIAFLKSGPVEMMSRTERFHKSSLSQSEAEVRPIRSEVKVSLAKLPSTDSYLIGRENEIAAMDEAWDRPALFASGTEDSLPLRNGGEGREGGHKVNVLTLVAFGGVGKTALVNKWLAQMAQDNYRGAERVYGWSFYSQGAAEGRQVAADAFIAAALTWFGDSDPTAGSPWDKGERLAELIKQQRTLLILDGLESLQNSPPVEPGRIKNPTLRLLLRELARHNPGLVVITTRFVVDDLKDFIGKSALELDLSNLSSAAGAVFLRHLGVKGMDDELMRASDEYRGHALALTLLGTYLTTVHGGDVRQRDKITRLIDERKQGAHARRAMAAYEHWLKNKPELDILRLMSLFDHPVESSTLEALKREPAIEGLTEQIQKLSITDWQYAVANLRRLRLLAEEDPYNPQLLDCHPLLRDYFSEQLQGNNPNAWHEARSRLYEYYKSVNKTSPDTLEAETDTTVTSTAYLFNYLNRLSPSSQAAFLWAEGLREAMGASEIYTEYLLVSLYQKDDGPTRQLLTLFDNETVLQPKLSDLANQATHTSLRLEDIRSASPEALRTLQLSVNTQEALRAAVVLADQKDSFPIRSRHLLAGLLAAPEGVAAEWVANLLQVDRKKLYELFVAAPDSFPSLYEIKHISLRNEEQTQAMLLERLSVDSRNSLAWAEGLRQAVGAPEMRIEYLLAGLFLFSEPVRDLLTLFDETPIVHVQLEELINRTLTTPFKLDSAQPVDTAALIGSPFSPSVVRALNIAGNLATEKSLDPYVLVGEVRLEKRITESDQEAAQHATIQSHHLFAGVLSISGGSAAHWIADLLRVDREALYTQIAAAPDALPPLDDIQRLSQRRDDKVRGINVSYSQQTVDWSQVRQAGIAFAFVKATQGTKTVDQQFASNWSGTEAVGILRGAYHVFEPNEDPLQQAQHFAHTVGVLEPDDLPPVLDVETSEGVNGAVLIRNCKVWLNEIERLLKRRPVIYTGAGFWNPQLRNDSEYITWTKDYALWLAQYQTASEPPIPQGWESQWTFWQYDEMGTVPGISGRVDLNWFNGTARELRRWLLASQGRKDKENHPSLSRGEALARIRFVQGSLLDQKVDALMHPSSPFLGFDGQIGQQIAERLGTDGVAKIQSQRAPKLGEAIATETHEFPARYLIHAPIRDESQLTVETVVVGVKAALAFVEKLPGVRSIAFPSVGTGQAGFEPSRVVAPILLATVQYLEAGTQLEQVKFVFTDSDIYQTYLTAYQALGGVVVTEERQYRPVLELNVASLTVGQRTELRVILIPETSGKNLLSIPVGILEVYCFVRADGLDVCGSEVIRLSLESDLPSAEFVLQAHVRGERRTYTVEFFAEASDASLVRLGQASGYIAISAPKAGEPRLPILPTLDIRIAPQPDFVLQVDTDLPEGDEGPHHLHYRLTSRLPGLLIRNQPVGEVILRPTELSRLRLLMHQLLRNAIGAQPEAARERLLALGAYLYDCLFPVGSAEAFRTAFWQAANQHTTWTWLIVEDGLTWLPWELIAPYRLEDNAPPQLLGERCRVGRWIEGLREVLYGEVPFGEVALVHYKPVEQPDDELRRWQSLINASSTYGIAQVIKPQTPVYGLHLLRHSDQLTAQRDIVRRTNQESVVDDETDVQNARLDVWHKRPIVAVSVLAEDGCGPVTPDEVGLLAERATGFLRAGVSAVVGPWWPTSEAADRIFWTTFYHLLEEHVILGEAVWRARLTVERALPDRPDWLAYTLFGDPRARPYWVEDSEGYASLQCRNPDIPLCAGKAYIFEARIGARVPLGYRDRLMHVEALPEAAQALFLGTGLNISALEAVDLQPAGRTLLRAAVNVTAPAPGNYLLVAQFYQGDEHLKTLRLPLQVGMEAQSEKENYD